MQKLSQADLPSKDDKALAAKAVDGRSGSAVNDPPIRNAAAPARTRNGGKVIQFGKAAGSSLGYSKVTLLDKWQLLQLIFGDHGLSQTAKVVAGVLIDHCNCKTGQCNPAIDRIALRIGRKCRVVLAATKELRARGWLTSQRRRGTSQYDFAWERLADDVRETAHQDVRETAHQEVRETAHPEPKKGETMKQNPPFPPGGEDQVEFDQFWSSWPTDPLESRVKAGREWKRLKVAERRQAYDRALRFVELVRSRHRKLCHAATYLAEKRFEGIDPAEHQAAVVSKPEDPQTGVLTVQRGSSQWLRWLEHFKKHSPAMARCMEEPTRDRWTVKSEWPPSGGTDGRPR